MYFTFSCNCLIWNSSKFRILVHFSLSMFLVIGTAYIHLSWNFWMSSFNMLYKTPATVLFMPGITSLFRQYYVPSSQSALWVIYSLCVSLFTTGFFSDPTKSTQEFLQNLKKKKKSFYLGNSWKWLTQWAKPNSIAAEKPSVAIYFIPILKQVILLCDMAFDGLLYFTGHFMIVN